MKPTISTFEAEDEYYFAEGCYINELSNSEDDAAVSIARARVRPGVTTRWHCLTNTSERYVIISGNGLVELGNLPAQAVGANDVVLIPPMCRQRITNTGADDLVFLAICAPRFSTDIYQDLESEKYRLG